MGLKAAYSRVLDSVFALGLIAVVAGIFYAVRPVLDNTLVALLLLIPVGSSTARWGLAAGITAAVGAFLAFNYLFIQPYYTFTVHKPGDLVVLLVFLIVAVVISQLVGQAQAGARAAVAREREAMRLYELSTALAGLQDEKEIAQILSEQIGAGFVCDHVEIALGTQQSEAWGQPRGTPVPERPPELTVDMEAVRGVMGGIRMWRETAGFSETETRLVQTFASQGALALERAALAQAEARAKVLEESDRLKSSLLSSVSHDLRTPLATIKAAASSLRSGEVAWDSGARAELLAAIDDETDHLNMLVGNLLDMSRIESGALHPQRKWNALSEIVHSVVQRMRSQVQGHEIVVEMAEDLPLVPVDYVQMSQVFTNLISNCLKFAPTRTVVRIKAEARGDSEMAIQVSNQGPPVPEAHLQRIFEKFYRVTAADRVTGTGLGLSICKGIIEAHGGRIWAENLPDGFAFNFTLPLSMDGESRSALPEETEAA